MRSGGSLNVIKGVRPDAMDTAREAAERSGLSLGQWINTAIIGTAAESGIRPRARSIAPQAREQRFDDQGFVAVNERLDTLARQLDRLVGRAEPVPAVRPADAAEVAPSLRELDTRLTAIARDLAPQSQATTQRLADAITRLNSKLDHLIVARPASPDLDRRVAAVDRALTALNRDQVAPAGPSVDWSNGLEGAVAEIAARQRVLDGVAAPRPAGQSDGASPAPDDQAVPAPDLSGLEKQLRHITEQLETLGRPCNVESQVANLRGELADIGRTLAEALPRRIIEGLQAEIRTLPERIEGGGEDAPELASVEQGLADIRDALQALAPAESVAGFDEEVKALSAKIDLLAGSGLDPEILQQIEQAIGELRAIAGRVASGEALAQLAGDVRQIGHKLDRFIDSGRDRSGGMESLAQRVDALAASIEARAGNQGSGIPPNFDVLINTLADRLESARPTGPDPAAFDRLQDQIVRLAQKLDASDGRLGHLGTIERTMTDLMAELKEARDSAIEAAQVAARSAAKEMLDQSAGQGAEVDTIRHEITELRETQRAIDRRTQDTLEAVHGTLERMVERLATIETDLQEARRPAPAAMPQPLRGMTSDPDLPQSAMTAPIVRASPHSAPLRPAPSAPPAMSAAADLRDVRPAMPDLPADHPLEPGSGGPYGRGTGSAADRIAASEAVLAAAKPQAPAEPGSKANFIAAARRAAQAAAADPSAGAQAGGEDKAYGSKLGTIGDTLARSRRPLVIGIGAFLLVIGTLHLVTSMLGSGDRPAGEPQRPAVSDPATPSRDAAPAPVPAPVTAPPAAAPPASSGAEAPRDPAAPPAPGRRPDGATDRRSALPAAPTTVATSDAARTMSALPAANGASPFTMGPLGDITGSINKPHGAATPAARAPTTALATLTVTPPAGADKLPVAIGGPVLRHAAGAGNPAAAYEIGIRYAEGRGVAQNFEEAIRWLDAAARGGVAPAQYRLGSLYEKGQGVKKDREAARKLYVAAAERGNGKAMHNLAVLYAEGLEGKSDYQMASQWFRKAADHGVSDSQYNLGILYARGIGVEQNLAESYKWFALAAAQGDVDAGKKREDVASRLDPQSLVAARLAVQTWTADPQPDEAITVKAPPGGWDAAIQPPAKPKAAAPVQRKTGA